MVNFTVSPNPVQELLKIELDNVRGICCFNIYNVLGVKVFSGTNASSTVNVDVTGFPGGIYFLEVKSNNTITTQKFIKN